MVPAFSILFRIVIWLMPIALEMKYLSIKLMMRIFSLNVSIKNISTEITLVTVLLLNWAVHDLTLKPQTNREKMKTRMILRL